MFRRRLYSSIIAPALLALGLLVGCGSAETAESVPSTPSAIEEPEMPSPITPQSWQEAMVSVTDLERTAEFFRGIGGYETLWQGALGPEEIEAYGLPEEASGEGLLMRARGSEHGYIRLVRFDNAGPKVPTRPGARAWDTGCFWSIMVRVKDMERVYTDAVTMGWWTETPIAYLEFGPSKLHVVVFKGPDGVQVQGYERLTTPLPEGFTPFERISQPFNIMQMTRDREAARELMVDVLGFETFYYGDDYTDEEPTVMPLGIPQNLTTTVPYRAGIFYPTKSEYGRMEYVEIDGLDGHDYADRCKAPNLGILSVSYPVDNVDKAIKLITQRGWEIERGPYIIDRLPYGLTRAFTIKAPDGAIIEFTQNIDD